jgi:DHA1 family solute carrier family 18 vesicular amine transporter 1/2
MLVGLVVLAAATLAFATVEPLGALVLARAAQGAAAAFSWVAGLALVAATSPIEVRARNLGLVLSAVSVGVLVGPPLGGVLAELGGRHLPFLVAAGLAFLDGALRLLLIGKDVNTTDDDPARMRDVVRVRGSLAVCAVIALGAGVIAAIEPVLPRHLASQGQGPIVTGLVFGAAVLASAFVTPAAGALTRRARISVLAGGAAAIAVAGFLVLAAGDGQGPGAGLAITVVGMALIGIGGGGVLGAVTPAMTTLGERSVPPAIGAAFALFNLSYAVGLFLGPAMSGPLVEAIGFGPAIGMLAALIAVGAGTASLLMARRFEKP